MGTPSSSSGGFNLGSVFNFLNPLIQSNKPDIILHDSPAIKTLPAPDLTKSGPHLAGGYAEQIEAKRRRDRERYNQHYRHPEHQSNNEAHQSHHQNQQQLQQQYQHQQASHHQSHQRDPQTHIQLHEPEHHVEHHQPKSQQPRQPTSQHHHTQQHQHQSEQDHIAQPSFVDVKLEHFVPGHVEDIEPPRRHRHPNLDRQPSNFSVLVSGLSKTPNPKELVNLFKEGVVAEHNHKAFITNNHVDAPEGFERI